MTIASVLINAIKCETAQPSVTRCKSDSASKHGESKKYTFIFHLILKKNGRVIYDFCSVPSLLVINNAHLSQGPHKT